MNTDYVVYDAAGKIIRTGSCPAQHLQLQLQEGELYIEAVADCDKDAVDPVTRSVIRNGNANRPVPVLPPMPSQQSLSTETQLDLLWQAMDAGTFPKAEPFYSAIKASKGRGA